MITLLRQSRKQLLRQKLKISRLSLKLKALRLLLNNLSNHRTLQNRVGIFLSGSFHVKINAKIICNYGKK